jgi:hypothetical protein
MMIAQQLNCILWVNRPKQHTLSLVHFLHSGVPQEMPAFWSDLKHRCAVKCKKKLVNTTKSTEENDYQGK